MTAAPGLDAVLRFVGDRTGLQFPDYRREAAGRLIEQAMARRRVKDPALYVELLRADPAAFDELLDRLTVGETYFFREPAQFDAIRDLILPDVLSRRAAGPLRVWSAACASGEEVYSLAVLLLEAGLEGRADVVGTDISPEALARAVRGEYREWSIRGDGGRRIAPYLTRNRDVRTVADSLRRLVRFERLNLTQTKYPASVVPPTGVDLILCRNVLIYFDAVTVAAVGRKLYDALAPGGWLVTASCDPPLGGSAPFARVVTPAGIVYRRDPRPGSGDLFPPPLKGRVRGEGEPSRDPTPPTDAGNLTPPPRGRRESEGDPSFSDPVPAEADSDTKEETAAGAIRDVRALADRDPAAAERACAKAVGTFPLSTELRLTHAMLLLGLGRHSEAARAARGALFLEPRLVVGFQTLGLTLVRAGELTTAVRAFRQARDLAAALPSKEPVRFGHGETAGQLVRAADEQLARIAAWLGGKA